LSSRSWSNLAKPATFSGANWLPVALSSASARPLGITTSDPPSGRVVSSTSLTPRTIKAFVVRPSLAAVQR
jgi:hypothetical protein